MCVVEFCSAQREVFDSDKVWTSSDYSPSGCGLCRRARAWVVSSGVGCVAGRGCVCVSSGVGCVVGRGLCHRAWVVDGWLAK